MATLEFWRNRRFLFAFPLVTSHLSVGRSARNDLVLPDTNVSRELLRLSLHPDRRWWVSDVGGQVSCNGQPLNSGCMLAEADEITFANWSVRYTERSFADERLAKDFDTHVTQIAEAASAQLVAFDENGESCRKVTHSLHWQGHGLPASVIELKRTKTLIGSAGHCHVSAADPYVSGQHGEIKIVGGVVRLKDLGSTNGTFVDGVKISEIVLSPGQKFRLGKCVGWIESRVGHAKIEASPEESFCGMIGSAPAMRRLFAQITLVAPTTMTVLIQGPTGSGKELVARAVHELSNRRSRPFCVINCGAIPKELVESELFGHVKGAFTGAIDHRIGIFEEAHGGTLFLDEIGELPLGLQAKLLRVLEAGTIKPVGANKDKNVDVRVVAATHQDLKAMVAQNRFREDLYYRLHVTPLRLLPLNERGEDIVKLACHLVREHASGRVRLTEEALVRLKAYSWPGNIRELKNTLLRAIIFCQKDVITPEDIVFPDEDAVFSAPAKLDNHERELIIQALNAYGWNKARAAGSLGIARSTLFRKINEYRIGK